MPTRSKRLLLDKRAAHGRYSADVGDQRVTTELRSFGRRRARRLSTRQLSLLNDVLPRVSLDPTAAELQSPTSIFPAHICEVWLEAGFGGGEHLIWQACQNPCVGFIGCEPFEDGIVKVLAAIDKNVLTNIRLYADDVRSLLRWLPDRSLKRVFILFPDPWPKKRHAKRRLVAWPLFELLSRVMEPGGELRVATDIGDYARTILLNIRTQAAFEWRVAGPADWRQRGPDWPQTRYEAKAAKAGRRCYFLRFRRVACR